MKPLRPPPYATELLAARRRGALPNVYIVAGDFAWRRAKRRGTTIDIPVPPDEDFTQIDWRCLAGLHVTLVVWNRPPDFVDALARHLVISGAALVAAIGQLRASDGDVLESATLFYRPAMQAVA